MKYRIIEINSQFRKSIIHPFIDKKMKNVYIHTVVIECKKNTRRFSTINKNSFITQSDIDILLNRMK